MYPVRSDMPPAKSPRIVITLAVAAEQAPTDLAARRGELYLAALRRHGADPVAVDAGTAPAALAAALDSY